MNYTNTVGETVIARYAVSANPNVADPQSAQILLTIPQPFSNHNGGQLQFGPDGYLYIGTGDGGSGGDPQNNGQSLGTLLGKILRIDVDRSSLYAIPPDNPFVRRNGAKREIWAFGLRNPWRFSFDRLTGDMFIGDVGQASWEEIDFQQANSRGGENYGWRLMEGKHCFNPSTNCDPGTLTLPIVEYDHSLGCSVTGGYRYRGARLPQLFGSYLYGDFCSGRIWRAARTSRGRWTTAELLDSPYMISTFGEDEAGELYLAHYTQDATAAIYRFVGGVPLVASLLPSSRSVQVGTPATAFATVLNVGNAAAVNVGVALKTVLPVAFSFQALDPVTGQLIGTANTPVTLAPGGLQTFLLTLTPTAAFAPIAAELTFAGENAAALSIPGVNTLWLSASVAPVPDLVAFAATLTHDGIVNISGANGTGVFTVATVNVGIEGQITVTADTNGVTLPVTLTLCQTDPADGQCISAVGPSATTTINAGATPSFGIFVQGNGTVPFNPATNRIFVQFKDAGSIIRGATSVAVRTQ